MTRKRKKKKKKKKKKANKVKIPKYKDTILYTTKSTKVTPDLLSDALNRTLRISVPSDAILMEQIIDTPGVYNVPVTVDHVVVSGLPKNYLDKDMQSPKTYDLKIFFEHRDNLIQT